ncbi:MAG: GNAT family N-acetyltransferase [Flavobacteriaceae bacterium]|nr:GNAT family N-acetyltransferase [Flavobacteriaceae bacterium]
MPIKISPYQEKYAPAFYDLNIEWLEAFFYVEDFDREVLGNPNKYIIKTGGHIFFALDNGVVVGTVALMPISKTFFELTKMAVAPNQRGKKIGQQLMQHCIDFSKENNLDKLIIYSSRKLENAIYIYRKYGFIEIPVEVDCHYKRCDIKLVLLIPTNPNNYRK